jgi:hypothetical protein
VPLLDRCAGPQIAKLSPFLGVTRPLGERPGETVKKHESRLSTDARERSSTNHSPLGLRTDKKTLDVVHEKA